MKFIKHALIYIYLAIVACSSLYFASMVSNAPTRLPCQVSEISPDFSTEQREACRQMRRHKL